VPKGRVAVIIALASRDHCVCSKPADDGIINQIVDRPYLMDAKAQHRL
jgi:hypothetical protein